MAKCPKCDSRKGKRFCPALQVEICPQCCGEGRLVTIPCPRECPHLEAEFYQLERRRSRAASGGKRFVESLNKLFSAPGRRQLAFHLQADVYYYLRHRGRMSDEEIAGALERLKEMHSRIVVPGSPPHPLVPFLVAQLGNGKRYPPGPDLEARAFAACIDTLVRHIRAFTGGKDRSYQEEIGEFFGALDFEADLDYEPLPVAAASEAGPEPRRSPGGVILPG